MAKFPTEKKNLYKLLNTLIHFDISEIDSLQFDILHSGYKADVSEIHLPKYRM